jgi:competence protein ComEA
MFSSTIQSHDEWIDTIQKMVDRGARGTNEQFGLILDYLAKNQTAVNVNAAPAEDIAPVLGVSDSVAQAVVARRESKPFTDIADLSSVPGVDAATVQARQNRIGF